MTHTQYNVGCTFFLFAVPIRDKSTERFQVHFSRRKGTCPSSRVCYCFCVCMHIIIGSLVTLLLLVSDLWSLFVIIVYECIKKISTHNPQHLNYSFIIYYFLHSYSGRPDKYYSQDWSFPGCIWLWHVCKWHLGHTSRFR